MFASAAAAAAPRKREERKRGLHSAAQSQDSCLAASRALSPFAFSLLRVAAAAVRRIVLDTSVRACGRRARTALCGEREREREGEGERVRSAEAGGLAVSVVR